MCKRSVRWLWRLDRGKQLAFASLQGELARKHGLDVPDDRVADSFVLLDEGSGRWLTRSAAVLELLRLLGWPWRVLTVLVWVPEGIRDAAYDWVARHRHQWFGPDDACELPDQLMRKQLRD